MSSSLRRFCPFFDMPNDYLDRLTILAGYFSGARWFAPTAIEQNLISLQAHTLALRFLCEPLDASNRTFGISSRK